MMKKKKNDIFINLIGDVTPIKKNNKLERNIPVINKTTSFQKRTKNKLSFSELKKQPTPPNISNFEIEINKTNKKLKKGKIPIDKKIDFHGLSLFDAESLFTHTINICYKKKGAHRIGPLLGISSSDLFRTVNTENFYVAGVGFEPTTSGL